MPVLFDRPGRRPGQLLGRSPFLQAVHATVPTERLGTLADVRITGAHANSLSGTLVAESGELGAVDAPEVVG
jgi:tRNA-2-methylthio-N6-dimethylallyladenosine synthase